MKKNTLGITGIVLAAVVAALIATMKTPSFWGRMIQFDGALIVVVLSLISTVRGSLAWLILGAIGIAELAYILF